MSLPSYMSRRLASIIDVCRTEKSAFRLWRRICNMLLDTVPGDLGAFAIMDPVTGLILDAYFFEGPALADTPISDFKLKQELCGHLDQEANREIVAAASYATGEPGTQHASNEDGSPSETIRHVARVSFEAGRHCWGGLCLIRSGAHRDFGTEEMAFLRALSLPVGTALRRAAAWKQAHTPPLSDVSLPDAGVMLIDRQHCILFQTQGVRRILDDLAPHAQVGDDGQQRPL